MASNISRQNILIDDSKIAKTDLLAGRGVVLDGDLAEYSADAGVAIFGVVVQDALAGESVRVAQLGLAPIKITTAGSLSAGDAVMVAAATGQFVTATSTNVSCAKIALGSADVAANGDAANAFIDCFNPITIA